jgi:hypothetical protein
MKRFAMRRSHAFAALSALAAIAVIVACGVDVVGIAPAADASGGGPDDGAPPGEGGAEVIGGDDGGIGVGVPFDAGVADASCDATLLDDPLSTIDSKKWLVTHANDDAWPKIETIQLSGGSMRDVVSLIEPSQNGARGAIWLATPVPTQALDVQFQYAALCGTGTFDGCADGMAAVWLGDTASVPMATAGASNGSSFGVPPALGGAGLAVDLFQNSNLGDPSVPALEVLALDGTKTPASYRWVAQGASDPTYGNGHVRTVRLHLRGAQLTVSVDGSPAFMNVAVPSVSSSAFGFTAATGGQNGLFYVWDFHAAFYTCPSP